MADSIVVKSKVKEVAGDCNVSGDFADALNDALVEEVKRAAARADANGRKTVSSKDTYIGKSMAKAMLVVKSKVKDVVGSNHNVSGDFADSLNEVANWMVMQAAERAKANGRKTIGARDL